MHLGTKIGRQQRRLWRDIEGHIFQQDANYIPTISTQRKQDSKEFFVLYHNGKPVGRAAATIDKRWMKQKGDKLGFIDDFIIDSGCRHLADMLIQHCLTVLKDKEMEGAIVRSQSFPALCAQHSDELPPFGMPCNPHWYIDIFQQNGFVKHKEWANFRLELPATSSSQALERWNKCLTSLKLESSPLHTIRPREIREYIDVSFQILVDHFGYTPMQLVDYDSALKFLLFGPFCRIAKMQIYILRNSSGRIVGTMSYHPDYNIAIKPLITSMHRFNPSALPRFFMSLRKIKRANIGAIGLTEDTRGKGLVRLVDFGLDLVLHDGYEQLDTGPVLLENQVVVKMVNSFCNRYGTSMRQMPYFTLLNTFQPLTRQGRETTLT
ncbi:MAG: hypothetical protein SVY53_04940 [Chloroflexota bacterium]|nr:hypothetical protein [Chloroflexota bacterium]